MKDRVLGLDTRRRIYETIQENPGLHLRAISRMTGLLPSLVEYHIRYLIKNDLVYTIKEQNYQRYFDATTEEKASNESSFNPKQKRILHLLRKDIPLLIVLLIMKSGRMKHKDITEQSNISGSMLSYYLGQLVDNEVLCCNRAGDEKGYSVKDKDELLKILIKGHIKPPSQVEGFIKTWEDFF